MSSVIPTKSGPLSRLFAWHAARRKRLLHDALMQELDATDDAIIYLADRRAELKELLRGLK